MSKVKYYSWLCSMVKNPPVLTSVLIFFITQGYNVSVQTLSQYPGNLSAPDSKQISVFIPGKSLKCWYWYKLYSSFFSLCLSIYAQINK